MEIGRLPPDFDGAALAGLVRNALADSENGCLLFPFDHDYTDASLKRDFESALKGRDAEMYRTLRSSADPYCFFTTEIVHSVEGDMYDDYETKTTRLDNVIGLQKAKSSSWTSAAEFVGKLQLKDEKKCIIGGAMEWDDMKPTSRGAVPYTGNEGAPTWATYRQRAMVIVPDGSFVQLAAATCPKESIQLLVNREKELGLDATELDRQKVIASIKGRPECAKLWLKYCTEREAWSWMRDYLNSCAHRGIISKETVPSLVMWVANDPDESSLVTLIQKDGNSQLLLHALQGASNVSREMLASVTQSFVSFLTAEEHVYISDARVVEALDAVGAISRDGKGRLLKWLLAELRRDCVLGARAWAQAHASHHDELCADFANLCAGDDALTELATNFPEMATCSHLQDAVDSVCSSLRCILIRPDGWTQPNAPEYSHLEGLTPFLRGNEQQTSFKLTSIGKARKIVRQLEFENRGKKRFEATAFGLRNATEINVRKIRFEDWPDVQEAKAKLEAITKVFPESRRKRKRAKGSKQ